MSLDGDTKLPTNEEIVEELTKNLESQCIDNEACEKQYAEGDSQDNIIPPDFDKSDEESDDKKSDKLSDDFIDEDLLKEQELNISEEEKLERKTKASELKAQGNTAFKSSEYLQSLNLYSEALKLCPLSYTDDRSILYANRAASKAKLDRKLSAIDDCSKAIELNSNYIRAYLRRANLYEETDKLQNSLDDYKKALELDPGIPEARAATVRLPPLIEEQNEKLKTEMLGKNIFNLHDYNSIVKLF